MACASSRDKDLSLCLPRLISSGSLELSNVLQMGKTNRLHKFAGWSESEQSIQLQDPMSHGKTVLPESYSL